MRFKFKPCTASIVLTVCCSVCGSARAAYPERPIRLVNPYAPGGLTDVVSRLLARHMTEAWGQQVIVDSRGGAGTTIGTEIVVRAPPDGYTLLCTTAAIAMMQAKAGTCVLPGPAAGV